MDEVDSVVCSLDNVFAPILAVNEYLIKNSEYRFGYKNSELKNKIESNKEEQDLIIELDKFEHLMISISTEIKEFKSGWNESDLKNFSAMSLLNKLDPSSKATEEIPQIIWDVFYSLLRPQSIGKGNVRDRKSVV